ncbi:MAG: hypothetical protein Terrestrivirus4_184 [Terrestrivirus sp.]|uniref:Uncharacterized protein n=1 Tax=Terrestrivirus sp. TaxID=2487775 RepID=A0A3G4ZMQ9_9VIRU|nr:MAG: hypothetical protein Terrestrivirus4_184 [Terrestrivirus sp.]
MSITIIVTTSAIQSHPSTEVIDQVINSFSHFTSSVNIAEIVIVCDGYNITNNDNDVNSKACKISQEIADNYEIYLDKLKESYPGPLHRIIRRKQHYGFARNLKFVLDRVMTKYVLVIQHDWEFVKPIDMGKLVRAMDDNNKINYINFISSSTTNYLTKMFKVNKGYNHKIDLNIVEKNNEKFGIPIVPLMFWYDKPHLCRTDFYKYFVFGKSHYNYKNHNIIKVKSFVEDSFGNLILDNVKVRGLSEHSNYGTYLFYETPNEEHLRHINGRGFITQEQRTELIQKNKNINKNNQSII